MAFSPLFAQVGGITGKVVYAKSGNIRVHVLGSEKYTDLGRGDFARWGPHGQKVAVKDGSLIYVINADGSNRTDLATDAGGDKNCPLEFHPNGNEVLYIKNDHIMAVNIHSKATRVLVDFVDCTGEIGMAADKNRLVCRDGRGRWPAPWPTYSERLILIPKSTLFFMTIIVQRLFLPTAARSPITTTANRIISMCISANSTKIAVDQPLICASRMMSCPAKSWAIIITGLITRTGLPAKAIKITMDCLL